MYTEKSVTYQFISNVTKGADGAIADVAALPEGSAAIVDSTNTILTIAQIGAAVAAGNPLRVAQRINGMVTYSPYFSGAEADIRTIAYAADTQQVTHLGYNGTAGELDATAQANYTLGIHLINTAGILNNTPMVKTITAFNEGGTQLELATRLQTAFDRVMSHEPRQYIRCDRIGDDQTGLNTINETLAVTNGATGVTVSDDHGLSAGAWVEIAGVLYQIVATPTTDTFTLDTAYKGVTNTTVAATAWGPATPVDVGLRFTGIAFPDAQFNPVTDIPGLIEFKLTFDRVSAPAFALADPTTIDYTTGAAKGQGTYQEVAAMEVYTTMNEGNAQLSMYPPTNYRRAAIAGNTYTTYVINGFSRDYVAATTGQNPASLFNIYIRVLVGLVADNAHFAALV